MGEWKDGTGPAGNCTKCPFGVTTPTEGSTSAAACAGGWGWGPQSSWVQTASRVRANSACGN